MNTLLRVVPRHEPRSRPAWAELSRLRVERARKAGLADVLLRQVADIDIQIEAIQAKLRAGVTQ